VRAWSGEKRWNS